ncbi:MAG: Rieske 2Fe-2S domain-containing protein, partial [Nitrospirota bacterium]|nr:Rieske 2Fe-2S domain-containing protein [Nitrospirota bacterium]
MAEDLWVDVGLVHELKQKPVQAVMVGRTKVALTYQDGKFGAINGSCNHVGGPLGEGTL